MWIENYTNTECKTYTQIASKFQADKVALEKDLGSILKILIPRKIQVSNVLWNPDIQFIEQRTGNNRIMINEMIDEFNLFRSNLGVFKWEDIVCSWFKVSEKWDMEVLCDFLGSEFFQGIQNQKLQDKLL